MPHTQNRSTDESEADVDVAWAWGPCPHAVRQVKHGIPRATSSRVLAEDVDFEVPLSAMAQAVGKCCPGFPTGQVSLEFLEFRKIHAIVSCSWEEYGPTPRALATNTVL